VSHYLIDADVAINALAGRAPAVQTVSDVADTGIAISIVTKGEVSTIAPLGRLERGLTS
jgi:hypothetical protein